MKRVLARLVAGQSLRHRAVALSPAEQRPVRAIATMRGVDTDVTARLFPTSLSPLLLGAARAAGDEPVGALELRMADAESGETLAHLALAPAGLFEHPLGCLDLLRPTSWSVRCIGNADLAWRYLLAWRHARAQARVPNAFRMTLADLKALNVFYMMPRPVYLVSVAHERTSNLFPMDLVGPFDEDQFYLALRLTSPSVATMRASGRIVVSGVPASLAAAAYQLGTHHKKAAVDWEALPFTVEPSPRFGIPAPGNPLGQRELAIVHSEAVGSHMLFATRIAGERAPADAPQLCHVSDMYASWRDALRRPFADI
jgi:flavin reductase (DIM6/NTAB) family NADH-FMN oxidoreductase RutF